MDQGMEGAAQQGSGWGMRLLGWVGVLTLVPALALAGMRFAPSQTYVPAAQVVGLFPVALVLALLALLCLVVARWWWAAAVAGLVALSVVLVTWERVVDETVAVGDSAVVDSEATIRVGAANAYFGRADVDALAEQLLDLDIACVSEATPDLVVDLQRTGLRAYSSIDASEGGASGTVLYARWPVRELPQVEGVSFRMPRGVVTTPSGTNVTVTCAHPSPPTFSSEALDRWASELRAIRDTVGGDGWPQVVMGDFNATWDHRLLREIAFAGDLLDAAIVAGEGLKPTWPLRGSSLPVPFVTIDHVLTDLNIVGASVEDVAGSDHRLVTATLAVPGSGDDP